MLPVIRFLCLSTNGHFHLISASPRKIKKSHPPDYDALFIFPCSLNSNKKSHFQANTILFPSPVDRKYKIYLLPNSFLKNNCFFLKHCLFSSSPIQKDRQAWDTGARRKIIIMQCG